MPEKNNKVPVIGLYGFSNSGKTSLIFKIIRKLEMDGFKCAVIKQTDKSISSEPQGKDTHGYRAAGAKVTSFASMSETNFVLANKMGILEIVEKISIIDKVDLIIIEGALDAEIEKIRLGDIPKRENTIYDYINDFEKLYKLLINKLRNNINGKNRN
jgi:molybdopterin-guanine dinucleotide biosynthesis protein MobB